MISGSFIQKKERKNRKTFPQKEEETEEKRRLITQGEGAGPRQRGGAGAFKRAIWNCASPDLPRTSNTFLFYFFFLSFYFIDHLKTVDVVSNSILDLDVFPSNALWQVSDILSILDAVDQLFSSLCLPPTKNEKKKKRTVSLTLPALA